MPLDPFIIEEIKKIEEEKRRRKNPPQPQPQLPIPEPLPRQPRPATPDDGNKRGVEIIEPGETQGEEPYTVRSR